MLTKIFINGDSLAVRIPKEMPFKEDQDVDIAREGDALTIRPIRRDSLAGVTGVFASFPAGFMTEGRNFNEQAERDWSSRSGLACKAVTRRMDLRDKRRVTLR